MQLTKDDITEMGIHYPYLDYRKFQQVVEFYEKYRVSTKIIKKNYKLGGVYSIKLWDDYPELVKKYLDTNTYDFNAWLFSYCFKEGLK